MKNKLLIDYRMAEHSGIGTVISNITPFLNNHFDLYLIVSETQKKPNFTPHQFIYFKSKIYTISEQLEFLLKIPKEIKLVWFPHFNYSVLQFNLVKVVTIHDMYFFDFKKNVSISKKIYFYGMMKIFLRTIRKIVTVSEFSKQRITHFTDISDAQIKVIPNAVSTVFSPNSTTNGNYILFVGNIKTHKNLKTLILSYNELENSTKEKFPLYLVGKKDGFISQDNEIEKLITTLNLTKYIHFLGLVPENELVNLYQKATIFIFPSEYEGFGLPILEAMASGCPVICSNIKSSNEIASDAALYFEVHDHQELKNKMEFFLNNENNRLKYINLGLQRIQNFNWEKSADEYIKIFNSLI